jgi:hypothetical protein
MGDVPMVRLDPDDRCRVTLATPAGAILCDLSIRTTASRIRGAKLKSQSCAYEGQGARKAIRSNRRLGECRRARRPRSDVLRCECRLDIPAVGMRPWRVIGDENPAVHA